MKIVPIIIKLRVLARWVGNILYIYYTYIYEVYKEIIGNIIYCLRIFSVTRNFVLSTSSLINDDVLHLYITCTLSQHNIISLPNIA